MKQPLDALLNQHRPHEGGLKVQKVDGERRPQRVSMNRTPDQRERETNPSGSNSESSTWEPGRMNLGFLCLSLPSSLHSGIESTALWHFQQDGNLTDYVGRDNIVSD